MTRYHVILSSYDIDTESKKRISTKKQTNNNNKKTKQKKTRVFFYNMLGGEVFFLRDNVRLFMKESAVFTRDEPKASKGMQA